MLCLPRNVVLSACALLGASGAWGQNAGTVKPAGPAVEPVLSHIPAGSLGFVVIPNIRSTVAKADKFIADIGLAKKLPSVDPDKPEKRASVLDLLLGAAQLGPGFNPDGGLAVVMLDPKAFGIDLLQFIPGAGASKVRPMKMVAEDDATEPAKPKIPFVIFVPGKSIKSVFGAYPMEPAGKYTLVNLRMGPAYAVKRGSYILLGPSDKALDAVLAAKKKAATDLPAEQVVAIGQSDLAYHINMKVAGPVIAQFLKVAEAQIITQAGPVAPLMGVYFGIYRDLIKQFDAITVAVRIAPTGLVFDEMASFRPGTAYSKAQASTKLTGKVGLNALPDLPYVLAMGGAGQNSPEGVKIGLDMIDSLLKNEPLKGLPEEEKARIKKIVRELNEQITGVQIVMGGAPAESGLFGMSFVIRCGSAEKVKALLAEKVKLAQGLIKHFGENEPEVKKFSIRYLKGMETVGGVSADAIALQHPKLDEINEDDRGKMRKVLGEDKIRFLVAAADKNTVVVTFGGSRPFLVEALKAAAGTGKIGTRPEDAEAMKYMPKKKTAVVLINAGNLYEVIVKGMKAMAPNEEQPPFKIKCKTPIALGVGQSGKSTHVVAYVPTKLIKEVVGIVMMFAGGGGGPPVGGDSDF